MNTSEQPVDVYVGKAFLGDYGVLAVRYDDKNHIKYVTKVAEFKTKKDAQAFILAVQNLLTVTSTKFLNDFKVEEIAEFETSEDEKAFLKCVKNLLKLKKPKKIRAKFYVSANK